MVNNEDLEALILEGQKMVKLFDQIIAEETEEKLSLDEIRGWVKDAQEWASDTGVSIPDPNDCLDFIFGWEDNARPYMGRLLRMLKVYKEKGGDIMSIWTDYGRLYALLKSEGVETLISRIEAKGFGAYEKEALKLLAQIPHPSQVSIGEIIDVAKECSSRYLEFAFGVAGIGELARRLISDSQAEGHESETAIDRSIEISSAEPSELADILVSQHMMLLNLNYAVRILSIKQDINLKGQCPSCHGPLVEVVVDTGGQTYELRLRCKDQIKSDCQKYDWMLQHVQRKEL